MDHYSPFTSVGKAAAWALQTHLGRSITALPTPEALMRELVEAGGADAATGDALDELVNTRTLSALRELEEHAMRAEARLQRRHSRILPAVTAARLRAAARQEELQLAYSARQEAAAALGMIVEAPEGIAWEARDEHEGQDFPTALRARLAADIAPLLPPRQITHPAAPELGPPPQGTPQEAPGPAPELPEEPAAPEGELA